MKNARTLSTTTYRGSESTRGGIGVASLSGLLQTEALTNSSKAETCLAGGYESVISARSVFIGPPLPSRYRELGRSGAEVNS